MTVAAGLVKALITPVMTSATIPQPEGNRGDSNPRPSGPHPDRHPAQRGPSQGSQLDPSGVELLAEGVSLGFSWL
jgi:hypothetical protein